MSGRYSPHRDELRFRAARLISGDFRNEDVSSLFLYLRERDDAGDPVTEIGDLVAHRFVRSKGPLKAAAQERYDALACMAHTDLDPDGLLPPRYWEALKANLKALHPKKLRKETGHTHREAKALLQRAKDNWSHISNGKELRAALTSQQNDLNRFLAMEGTIREPFTDAQLIRELNVALNSAGISQRPVKGDAATFVTLFTVSKMHNAVLMLEHGGFSVIQVHPTGEEIIVYLETPFPQIRGVEPTFLMTPHFRTSLAEKDYCDITAIHEADGRSHSVEATANLRLSLLK